MHQNHQEQQKLIEEHQEQQEHKLKWKGELLLLFLY
jgi:hypothetical protein